MSILKGGNSNRFGRRRDTMDWFFDVVFPKLFINIVALKHGDL